MLGQVTISCRKRGDVRFTDGDMAVRKKCIIFVETKNKYMLLRFFPENSRLIAGLRR